MAQRRKTVGLSQERLADIVGVDRSTVVRWERADSDPQPWHRPRLASALRITVDELANLLTEVDATPPPYDRLDYVLRHPGSVDLVAIAHLRQRTQLLDEQYERVASTTLLAEAGQLHGQTVFLRQSAATTPLRRELCAAEVESATLMGQLVWDASQRRDHAAAVGYFEQAIAAARQAREPVAEAHAELRKSYVALYGTRNPKAGLALAQHAADASHTDSHVIAGLATLHAAEAHAMLDDARACEQALGHAETHLHQIHPDDPARPLHCPSQQHRLAGSCWLRLGEADKAENALDQACQVLRREKKAAAIVFGNLALVAIQRHDVDTAAARIHQAVDVIEQNRGAGGLNVAFTATRQLRRWRHHTAVHEVTDRLLTLMTAASTDDHARH